MGSQKSVVTPKKSANARLPLSFEVRGRRRESARPLTPVISETGKIQLKGAATARAENGTQVLGEREERATGRASGGEGTRAHRKEKKEKNWKTCAR
ncbi:Uncharacterized protein DBV15_10245 [Temnothorax longispinosus]|uniref:Uncharacterized protein n=1 Tax=Temnothorax longispinosus TaxID=300112 RepID=A0A4S2JR95_9HYME|nr:Uncharacterized protein DBV15_10245 [Temnothorax longispinosus]